jgi:hypothetical protein
MERRRRHLAPRVCHPPRGTGILTVPAARDLLGELLVPAGVAAHDGSSVIVGLNGLRLLRESAWPPGSDATERPTV